MKTKAKKTQTKPSQEVLNFIIIFFQNDWQILDAISFFPHLSLTKPCKPNNYFLPPGQVPRGPKLCCLLDTDSGRPQITMSSSSPFILRRDK